MKARFIKLVIGALLLLGIPGIFLSLPALVKVNHLDCKSQYGPCGAALEEKIKKSEGLSLRGAKGTLGSLLKNEVGIEDFSIQYKIPDRLVVDVILTKPKFALKKEGQPQFVLIDKEGIALRWEDSTNLPFVETGGEVPNVGEIAQSREIFALNLMYDVFSAYEIQMGKITDDSLVIDMEGGLTVLFPLEGDKDVLTGSLALILAKLKLHPQDSRINVREIDLRFKNPVLR